MMKLLGASPLEIVNRIGFSLVYLVSTFVGSMLFFVWLLLLGAVIPNPSIIQEASFGDPSPIPLVAPGYMLVATVFYMLLVPVIVYFVSLFVKNTRSDRGFFIVTSAILLLSYYISFTSFFKVHHHVYNPAFYAIVFVYIFTIAGLLTYIRKNLLGIKIVKTSKPFQVYVVSLFAFVVLFFWGPYGKVVDGAYSITHNMLFNTVNVNIYFLDWSGFTELWMVLIMLLTLTITTLIFNRAETKKK